MQGFVRFSVAVRQRCKTCKARKVMSPILKMSLHSLQSQRQIYVDDFFAGSDLLDCYEGRPIIRMSQKITEDVFTHAQIRLTGVKRPRDDVFDPPPAYRTDLTYQDHLIVDINGIDTVPNKKEWQITIAMSWVTTACKQQRLRFPSSVQLRDIRRWLCRTYELDFAHLQLMQWGQTRADCIG